MRRPQCIAVVDGSGHLLAFVRMDGAKFLSIETAQRKAIYRRRPSLGDG